MEKNVHVVEDPMLNFARLFVPSKHQIKEYQMGISNYIDSIERDNESMRKHIDTYCKDKEVEELKERVRELESVQAIRREFSITDKELEACREWEREHTKKRHKGESYGCIGGRYSYILIPTSIGTIGTVKCVCGESFDFREL